MKVSIAAFDLADNATGRADLLARLLAPRWEVEVVGPRFGPALWRPARDGAVHYRAFPAGRDPGFARVAGAVVAALDGDLLVASKPRPTSFGLALRARRRRWRPLLLDIDDWEVGFYLRGGVWGCLGRALNLADPNGLARTWLAERRVGRADAVTVASTFLQRRFGGTLLPHARDTEAWDPARFAGGGTRAALGVGAAPLVMFLGTPRAYKGVDDLVEAVGLVGGAARLALVGADPAGAAARGWARHPWVRVVGEVPFDEVPRWLAAADVVAVPQRETPDTVGQVPAKLFDAMALARPIVATAVSMIPEVLEGCGVVVPPGDVPALAGALRRLLGNPPAARALGRLARERCEAHYSYRAARAVLFPLVERLLAR